MFADRSKIFFWVFLVSLFLVCLASLFGFPRVIEGDGITYVEAIRVLQGQSVPAHFVPNRILTTFLGLSAVTVFSRIFGGIEAGWSVLAILFYFVLNLTFYRLISRIFRSQKVAFLAAIFLATNYAVISFGLGYWMDIGGWVFYLLSLYFLFSYSESQKDSDLLTAAMLVGIGGLFKEYAFPGAIAIAIFIILENRHQFRLLFQKLLKVGVIISFPTIVLHLVVYHQFGYTYFDWLRSNQEHYIYSSRLVEYVKSAGSLFNILALPVLGGFYLWLRQRKELDQRLNLFIISVLVSVLPVLIWPAITQRILAIALPGAIIFASFLFKRYERYWWLWSPLLVVYIWASFFMDSYILHAVNLPF